MPRLAEWLSFAASLALPSLFLGATAGATNSGRTVGFQFTAEKGAASSHISARRSRRDSTSVSLSNEVYYYRINASIGTPGQTVGFSLDTGSADIWFPHARTEICEDDGCEPFGGDVDITDSKTFVNATEQYGGNFNISYRDGTEIDGDYIFDTFAIGDMKVENLTMGLASRVSDEPSVKGIMGVGMVYDEAHHMDYPNLPVQLLHQGYIDTMAYSIWLNDVDSEYGSILFGGVDTEKYQGDLITTPITSDEDFYVELLSLNYTTSSGERQYSQSNINAHVLLDTGATRSTLPSDIVDDLREKLGAKYDSQYDMWFAPCKSSTGGTLDFGFSGGSSSSNGPVVKVNIDKLVYPYISRSTGKAYHDDYGNVLCRFGIGAADKGGHLNLGDTFLRSAYVVYDLHNKNIALANTKFNVTESNVREITNSTFAELGTVKFPEASASATETSAAATATATSTKQGDTSEVGSDDETKSSAWSLSSQPFWVVMVSAAIGGLIGSM